MCENEVILQQKVLCLWECENDNSYRQISFIEIYKYQVIYSEKFKREKQKIVCQVGPRGNNTFKVYT